jgi:light-regulated signal transduction histidine kinase (bacteriophytochrome)/CheY-like chemotaxis protein
MGAPTVDLTNCDREPIHTPGSIQPHGAMLVCDPASFEILFASENTESLIGHSNASPVGLELGAFLGAKAGHDIRNALAKAGHSEIAGVVLGVPLEHGAEPVDVTIHRHDGRLFVELERSSDKGKSAQDALDLTQGLIRRIGLETTVDRIAASGAKLIRAMLGYDRVMVYQFLHNGAGRVIAEAKRSSLSGFIGQHFPASDIPYQARRLYLLNSIRMIGDVNYEPIPLRPGLAAGGAPIDMSFAQLRSVSPIHCEYLRNMGVSASMSISIVVSGELWGLISCHHDSPKVVPIPLRIGADLFGQYFSLQISIAQHRAQVLASTTARERLDKIVAGLRVDGSLMASLQAHMDDFATLMDCDGIGLWVDGEWSASGTAPPQDAVPDLLRFIAAEAKAAIWQTQEIGAHLPLNRVGHAVAGVLAVPLSWSPRDYLLFFRNEESHNIEWAGAPIKTVVGTPQGERLTPRGSFQTWLQDVKGRSKPWTGPEVAVAEAIRTYLRDIVLRHNELTAEERALAEHRRRVLNDELNHRVKNIIALVKSIALQTGAHASSVADYSASLEGRLRALAYAHDQSLGGGSGDLSTLVEAEASLHRYGSSPDRVVATGPRVRLDDRTFGVLALVIHEMMTNAAKYGALSTPTGRLALDWDLNPAGDCEIIWQETGGPTVSAPTRDGFGTKLIESTVAYDLGGSAEVEYAPSGVRARFVIPAVHVGTGPRPTPVAGPTEVARPSLAGRTVLVVEDQALIAMDTEATLRKLGASDVRLAPSVEEALALIDSVVPDLAVLDFNLGAGDSAVVADRLLERTIPFVFATGYGDGVTVPGRFQGIPVVRKPINGGTLAAKICLAMAGSASAAGGGKA